jgi:hypothetical protein
MGPRIRREPSQGEIEKTLHSLNVEWKYIKSFATEENLMKKIDKEKTEWPEHNDRFMVVRTPEGRWNAVVILDRSTGGYLGRYEGFRKV